VGHVFARLAGHGYVLMPHWPYKFEQHPSEPETIRVVRGTTDGPSWLVVRPGDTIEAHDAVDASEGPDHAYWQIQTSVIDLRWPRGFTVESPLDEGDNTPFLLCGPGEATIFPQGPMPSERVADRDALVAPGQTVVNRDADGIELTYHHDGEHWWQAHRLIPYGNELALVLTAQSLRTHADETRAAVEAALR
jgi:hypothetical protein